MISWNDRTSDGNHVVEVALSLRRERARGLDSRLGPPLRVRPLARCAVRVPRRGRWEKRHWPEDPQQPRGIAGPRLVRNVDVPLPRARGAFAIGRRQIRPRTAIDELLSRARQSHWRVWRLHFRPKVP